MGNFALLVLMLAPPPAERPPELERPGVIREGAPYGYIAPLHGDDRRVVPLQFQTTVQGSCDDASLTLRINQVETAPAARTLKATVTRFSVRDGDTVVTTDPNVLRDLRGHSVVAARPDCEWPVLGLEMILASHDDEPRLIRRVLQFKDGEVSYFFQEPLDSMDRVRWAVPR